MSKAPPNKEPPYAPLLALSYFHSSLLLPLDNHSISGHMTYRWQPLISDHVTKLYNFYIVAELLPPLPLLQIPVTWPDAWVINPFLVTPSSTPRPPPWVYKLTQDLVECAVPWQIYYWPLLLLQPQQHVSAEVSLQPDSPAHRHSLSTTPAWVHSYRWLLSESQVCV